MHVESTELLVAALSSGHRWVRMGASFALPTPLTEGQQQALLQYAERLELPADPAYGARLEHWACALNLARRGLDAAPTLCRLMNGVDRSRIDALLIGDIDEWGSFVHDLSLGVPSNYQGVVAAIGIAYRRWNYIRAHPDEASLSPGGAVDGDAQKWDECSYLLQQQIRFWSEWMSPTQSRELKSILDPVSRSFEPRDAADRKAALDGLSRIALTSSNFWASKIAAKCLMSLGSAGSVELLAALDGRSRYLPSREEIEAIQRSSPWQEGASELRDDTGAELSAYMAATALETTFDEDVADAVVRYALSIGTATSGRAQLVLHRMSLDMALPALAWHAINALDWRVACAAHEILTDLTVKPSDEPPFQQIRGHEYQLDLDWLRRLVPRPPSLDAWRTLEARDAPEAWQMDRRATLDILGSAIGLHETLFYALDISYRDSSPWDKFMAFSRRLGGMLRAGRPRHELKTPQFDFSRTCRLNDVVPLRVRLADGTSSQGAEPMPVDFRGGEQVTKVLVVLRSRGFSAQSWAAGIEVPLRGESQQVTFLLHADAEGDQAVEVMFFVDAKQIGYYTLVCHVGLVEDAAPADTHVFERYSNEALYKRNTPTIQLLVDENPSGRLEFSIVEPSESGTRLRSLGASPTHFDKASIERFIADLSSIAKQLFQDTFSREYLEAANNMIAAFGFKLFSQIFPEEFLEIARSWKLGSLLVVNSNTSWVPWELVAHDVNGPVWGDLFLVVRSPRLPSGKQLRAGSSTCVTDPSSVAPAKTLQRILLIVGDEVDLASSTSLAEEFRRSAPVTQTLTERSMSDVRQQIKDADLVHFFCHGRKDPSFYLRLGPNLSDRIYVFQIAQLPLPAGTPVFLNACSSTSAELFLCEFENAGFEFYRIGARPVIGTLVPVPQDDAHELSARYYHWLLQQRLPAVQALQRAKRDMAERGGPPIWNFYSFYGSSE